MSKTLFDDNRDKTNIKMRDLSNQSEEFDVRMKILERYVEELKADNLKNKEDKSSGYQKSYDAPIPDMEAVFKRITDLEGYANTLQAAVKRVDLRLKKEVTLLTDNKADIRVQKDVEKEISLLNVKLDQIDLHNHDSKEDIEKRLQVITDEFSSYIDKIKLHKDILQINTSRIEKAEYRLETLSKVISKLSKEEIDLSQFDRIEDRLKKLGDDIRLVRDDFTTAIKEIRDILYLKADDEDITELENKIVIKLNDLAENIWRKFADKTETLVGFKNANNQIRELFKMLLTMPKEKDNEEVDAMFSKKPLGGFSWASCDKTAIVHKTPIIDSVAWNQMPFRDKTRLSKMGRNFSRVLNSYKSEERGNTTYRQRIQKLGEVSESITEYVQSRIEDNADNSQKE